MLDGVSMGTCYFYYELPENERVEMTMIRNPKYKNWMDCKMVYFTNTGEELTTTSNMTWNRDDKSFSLKVNDLLMTKGDKTMAQGFFTGEVSQLDKKPDVFEGKDEYLYGLEVLDWRKIRDDSEAFVNEVLAKTSMSVLMQE